MITGFSHTVQLSVLIKSVGAGFFLGFVFSVFMLFNALYGKNTVIVIIRDIIYFIFAAIFTFMFLLKYNAGTLRFYILAGEGIGFCLFYLFPGISSGRLYRAAARGLDKRKKRIHAYFCKKISGLKVNVSDKKQKRSIKRQKRLGEKKVLSGKRRMQSSLNNSKKA